MAGGMPKGLTAIAAGAVTVLLTAGCSVQDGSGNGPPERSTTTAAETTPTTSEPAPAAESVGLLTIDDRAFDLTADCFAPGAGELLVLAVGVDAEGTEVQVYVEAFLGAPYLAVELDGELLEPSIERPIEFLIDGDVIRADDVVLVGDLDLETGDATDAGLGTLVIECRDYLDELPESFGR